MRKFSVGVVQLVAAVAIGGLVVGACLAALIPGARDLAEANEANGEVATAMTPLSQRTTVYANDAETEIGVLGLEDRQYAALDEVPQVVVDAVIATEDGTFWTNPGFDLRSVLRALDENVAQGRITQGGSTITQQLAKLRLVGLDRDLNRKVRELVMAHRINDELSKEQILEQYLNTVYFGQGSYGIKSAAGRFFTTVDPGGTERPKRLEELELAEAALLAGSIQNPEGANPFLVPERALQRRGEVLRLMLDDGYVTPEEVWEAAQVPLPTTLPPAELRPDNYFVEEVQRRLLQDPRLGETADERENAVLRGGLRVVSTLDMTAQHHAQAAVDTVMGDQAPFTGALVAMDPQTGAVKAVVGGPGFEELQYNIATQPPGRQPGSVYKVVTLAAALEAGYSPNDLISGASPCMIEGYGEGGLGRGPATNAEGGGGGTATLRSHTARSVNCAFLRLTEDLGVARVAEMANRLGIPDIEGLRVLPTSPNVTSITLGSIEATPLEIATVGSVLAAGGVLHQPIFYERVLGPDGEVIIDNTGDEGERVVSYDIASCAVDILRDTITGGTGGAARIDRDAAGKTGTTDDRTDAWFLGMTPSLVAAVWRGAPDATVSGAGFGGQLPAQVWRAFMTDELADETPLEFPPPGPSCARSGGRVGDALPAPMFAPLPEEPLPLEPEPGDQATQQAPQQQQQQAPQQQQQPPQRTLPAPQQPQWPPQQPPQQAP